MKCKHCGAEIEDNFQKIVCKKLKKEFRIYKWEDKPLKDFIMPDEFDFAEFNDFIYLHDNKLIKLEVWKDYFVKHFSKVQQAKGWFSRVDLNPDGNLGSYWGNLAYSGGYGRVVICRSLK